MSNGLKLQVLNDEYSFEISDVRKLLAQLDVLVREGQVEQVVPGEYRASVSKSNSRCYLTMPRGRVGQW